MATAVVAGALANKPNSGGEAWVRLSWVLGLRRLGWDVWFVERLPSAAPEGLAYFEQVVGEFGLEGRVALLGEGGEPLVGVGEEELGRARRATPRSSSTSAATSAPAPSRRRLVPASTSTSTPASPRPGTPIPRSSSASPGMTGT